MTFVLDACAIIAFLRDEEGAELVENMLMENECLIHAINLCEVYYDFFRSAGEEQAKQALMDLESIGLNNREDMDYALWQTAGVFKATIKRISLADCFAMALSKRLNAELITTDHHEFDPIANKGICSIRFVR